ncbi:MULTISPECIES: DUF262 domain-containing protein [Bacillus cereus group]|uniref:DUF262 domain-containing protein n=1 Tax=Bacillus thuringiensis subsp. konkukian (strain 97-27) TaxID=281309 RepID=Q6HMN3_BACHK|nr:MULTISPECIES: DUF262 domain-containing protein [Bacillus cereus group]EKS8352924.1 DUF262 domain-containing protein [Bacillus cereus]AAT59204.1 conserved hypothetical protein [[Bacillus thuringiensis] serovar konkukian str. 97-27]AJI36492.1 hypothetical protein BG06_1524 [Bacillus thuringiensis]MEC3470457.1 DUF262 domain-containing HNH endonuclease family protein [Bacillus tropicus]QKI23576.1 DUF262 domain-containing protein [Bacillus thuringiensis]
MSIKNFNFKSIGSFLQDGEYHIPDYQREYSWEENQIEDFWMDLKNLRNNEEEEHFFGQIVVHDDIEDKVKYIIDGQQRTTTSVVLLSVFNKIFTSFFNKDSSLAIAREISEDIRIKYIGRWSQESNRLKLKISDNDNEFFIQRIQIVDMLQQTLMAKSKSQKRLEFAFEYLMEKMSDEVFGMSTQDKIEVVRDFYENFINNFKVMYVETSSLEEAFIIFESLNARGKGLETADLLKNHIFKNSKKQINSVKNKWESMLVNLDGTDATKFIRHYWNSKEEFVRSQSLYKKMRLKINSESKCLQLMNELEKLAYVYSAISQKDDISIFNDSALNDVISNLKNFNASSFYPVILAMYNRQFNEKQILQVAQEIENLIFRNIIIAKNVANKYEVFFAGLAYSISNDELSTKEVITKINKMKINDEEFKIHFATVALKTKPIIRYIYKKLNKLYMSNEIEISNNNNVHIEHILPVTIGDWDISEDVQEEYLWRLGNLTLLGNEYNKKILNKLFDKKVEMYRKSSIEITKQITEYRYWNTETIEERQKSLAGEAIKIW